MCLRKLFISTFLCYQKGLCESRNLKRIPNVSFLAHLLWGIICKLFVDLSRRLIQWTAYGIIRVNFLYPPAHNSSSRDVVYEKVKLESYNLPWGMIFKLFVDIYIYLEVWLNGLLIELSWVYYLCCTISCPYCLHMHSYIHIVTMWIARS